MIERSLQIYHIEKQVRVLGPGKRFAVWVQGCPFSCPGCCAPDSQPKDGGKSILTSELLSIVLEMDGSIEGITISGGEPFAQADALSEFLTTLHNTAPHLTVMVFSGFSIAHLRGLQNSSVDYILDRTDILVDEIFRQDLLSDAKWTGTSNQTVHFLSNRYDCRDMERSHRGIELFADDYSGELFAAGIPFPKPSMR